MPDLWYFEQRALDTWSPCTAAAEPMVKRGRIRRSDGLGPSVRAVKRVAPQHRSLGLDELHAIYGPGGEDAKGWEDGDA